MTVGLLLITHNFIGDELLKAATTTLNCCPLETRILRVQDNHDDIDELVAQALSLAAEINSGSGVLVLTDMYGSTPGNVAIQLLNYGPMIVVAGLNLPMLIRVLNYAKLSLPELAKKAANGGYQGIVLSTPDQRGYAEC